MGASLLSINGELRSLFDRATLEEERSQGYKKIEIGKPIIIRYLYFFLQHKRPERKNELMISTFVKATETKSAAAEAINFFDKDIKTINHNYSKLLLIFKIFVQNLKSNNYDSYKNLHFSKQRSIY